VVSIAIDHPAGVATPPSLPGTAQEHAVHGLRWLIVSGALKPGQLVNQEDVAEQAGVSLAPIREALRTLEQEGQVTYLPRGGYFITELRIADLEEIYELRQILEERAARGALRQLGEEDLDRIDGSARVCASAAKVGDVATELVANRGFHLAILEPCGQPHLIRLIRMLWNSTEAYRAMYYNLPEERTASLDSHAEILRALRRHDADGLVDALNAHRERALHVLRALLAHLGG
jgi:DNA-binding GntR family transcriptional regulator